ncbi:MAG: HIT family protein [Bacteroidota bacterium]
MSSIFSKIIAGTIPAYKVAETDEFLAFLDIRPMMEGHTLCVPKREIDYYFDLEPTELSGLTLFSQRVAKAIQQVIPCNRVAVGVLGLEVPHAHVHLVPINTMSDFRFGKHLSFDPAEMAATAAKIQKAYAMMM